MVVVAVAVLVVASTTPGFKTLIHLPRESLRTLMDPFEGSSENPCGNLIEPNEGRTRPCKRRAGME